jgi:hypothetical protein
MRQELAAAGGATVGVPHPSDPAHGKMMKESPEVKSDAGIVILG